MEPEELDECIEQGIPLEYGHSLTDLIAGQTDLGFSITGFYEDICPDLPLYKYHPAYIATRAHQIVGGTMGTLVEQKQIALVAHDNKKNDLLEWARFNRGTLSHHFLSATGTTGELLGKELGLPITRYASGPLGGDQQVGAAIAEGKIDCLIFFWDPLEPQPHDPDIKALLRLAVLYNIPTACNRSTADFIISSPLMSKKIENPTPDLERYTANRQTRPS